MGKRYWIACDGEFPIDALPRDFATREEAERVAAALDHDLEAGHTAVAEISEELWADWLQRRAGSAFVLAELRALGVDI